MVKGPGRMNHTADASVASCGRIRICPLFAIRCPNFVACCLVPIPHLLDPEAPNHPVRCKASASAETAVSSTLRKPDLRGGILRIRASFTSLATQTGVAIPRIHESMPLLINPTTHFETSPRRISVCTNSEGSAECECSLISLSLSSLLFSGSYVTYLTCMGCS